MVAGLTMFLSELFLLYKMLVIVAVINEFWLNLYLYMLNQYYYLNGSGADQVLIRIVPLVQNACNGSSNKRILAEFVPLYQYYIL